MQTVPQNVEPWSSRLFWHLPVDTRLFNQQTRNCQAGPLLLIFTQHGGPTRMCSESFCLYTYDTCDWENVIFCIGGITSQNRYRYTNTGENLSEESRLKKKSTHTPEAELIYCFLVGPTPWRLHDISPSVFTEVGSQTVFSTGYLPVEAILTNATWSVGI